MTEKEPSPIGQNWSKKEKHLLSREVFFLTLYFWRKYRLMGVPLKSHFSRILFSRYRL